MKFTKLPQILVIVAGSLLASASPFPAIAQPTSSPSEITPGLKTLFGQPAGQKLNPATFMSALDQNNLSSAVRQIELDWKQKFESYYQGQLTSQYLDLEQMMLSLARLHRLTGKKTALVYAIPTPENLELILVTPNGEPIHRRISAAPREKLQAVAQTFRMGVVDPLSRAAEYLPAAQQLYAWLIAPLEPTLQARKIDNLIFCVGPGLRSLPMAALHDGKQFLVEKYSLALIPAFNLLDQHPAVLPGVKVLAMGASEFTDQPPLPAVPTELEAIADTLWPGKSLLNQNFTIDNLKAQRAATPYGIVHLATHAEFLPGAVNNSYIQFWNERLQPHRLRELGLRIPTVQLLVLSACQTALGDPQAELGFAGLAVQSGSKAALASLWSVSDQGTLMLMTQFYQALQTAPIKAEALREAQLALLRHQTEDKLQVALRSQQVRMPEEVAQLAKVNLSHPYYWAAFTLIGNPW